MKPETMSPSPEEMEVNETNNEKLKNDEEEAIPRIEPQGIELSNNSKLTETLKNLEQLELTGDVVIDGKAYLDAIGISPETLAEPHKTSFLNENPQGIIDYFTELQGAISQGPKSLGGTPEKTEAKEEEIINAIISNHKDNK